MGGVLIGFAVIGSIIALGYLVARLGVLGPHAQFVLGRLIFFVLSPFLLFTVLGDADVHALFSSLLVVSAIAAIVSFALFALVAFGFWRRPLAEGLIGTASAGWVNANNIGLPVAVYVIGDGAISAPVIMMQLVIFTPIILTVLDVLTSGRTSIGRVLSQPFRNPIIIGSVLGVVVSATGIDIPDPIMEPFHLVAGAGVPMVLFAFGMSLYGRRALAPGSGRRDVLLASAIKLIVMPLVAWVLGEYVFGLDGRDLFAVVVLASLPTAQNVFNYAQRYETGLTVARDTVLITTAGSLPLLLVVALLLG